MSLLTLPTELRQDIYAYLTTSKRITYPFGVTAITSISHTPPSSALQSACRFLYHDISDYFWHIATVRITPGASGESIADNEHSMTTVQRAEHVEFVMLWEDDEVRMDSIDGLPGWQSGSMNWSEYMATERNMICMLSREAEFLKKLVLTVSRDRYECETWHMKEARLAQLKDLKKGVELEVGSVSSYLGVDYGTQRKVEEYVDQLNAETA